MTERKFVIENIPPPPGKRRRKTSKWDDLPIDSIVLGQSVVLEIIPVNGRAQVYHSIYSSLRNYLIKKRGEHIWKTFLIYRVPSKKNPKVEEVRLAKVN